MKHSPEVFRDQPVIGEGEDPAIAAYVSNWAKVNAWLQTNPPLDKLKKAALYEAENNRRPQILDRLLSRIFKQEKDLAMHKLLTLKK